MSQRRLDFIDVAKGFGILFVVWAHILLVGWTHRAIYAFHMPFFFFVSGLLFNKGKYDSFCGFVAARARRLLIPYVLYSVGSWIVWALFRLLRGDEVSSYFMPLLQTVIAQGSGAYMVHNSALWFVPCLFVTELMFFFIAKAGKYLPIVICAIIATVGVFLAHWLGQRYLFCLPWNLDAAFYALLFYGAGNLLKEKISLDELNRKIVASPRLWWLIWAILTAALLWLAMFFGECSMGSSSYGCSEGIFFLRAFVGCAALLLFSILLVSAFERFALGENGIAVIRWCGQNSLDIMSTHIPVKGVVIVLMTALLKLKADVSEVFAYSTVAFLATMAVVVAFIFVLKFVLRKFKQRAGGVAA